MKVFNKTLAAGALALLVAALSYIPIAAADDMASFATGGYATGLRTMAMMHMIDKNGDGMISKDEWIAFQEETFAALDKDKSGFLDEKEFAGPDKPQLAFATAAYARGLRTKEMFAILDTNHDGKISHDEFISYQQKIFDMMDAGKKGMLGPHDFIRKD